MTDLQPMTVDSAHEPMESSAVFDEYNETVQVHNNKNKPQPNQQLLQKAAEFLAENPELTMAL